MCLSLDFGFPYAVHCGHIFTGEEIRYSRFKLIMPRGTRMLTLAREEESKSDEQKPSGIFQCHLGFQGRKSDVVQLVLTKPESRFVLIYLFNTWPHFLQLNFKTFALFIYSYFPHCTIKRKKRKKCLASLLYLNFES